MSIICQHVHRLELRKLLKFGVARLPVKRERRNFISDMHVQNIRNTGKTDKLINGAFGTLRPLGYERVYLPLYRVADTPFHIQGDDLLR